MKFVGDSMPLCRGQEGVFLPNLAKGERGIQLRLTCGSHQKYHQLIDFKPLIGANLMQKFLRFRTSRRRQKNSFSDSLAALESRQLPSAAPFPLPVAAVSPEANGNVHDYTGNWKINGNVNVTLSLSQNSNNKLSGLLFASNSISVEVRGKVGDGMNFTGKGFYQGLEGKITFSVNQTTTTNGLLVSFGGDMTLKYKGYPKATYLMTAERI